MKNKKNILIIIIITLSILVLLCAGAIVYLMYNTPADKFSKHMNIGYECLENAEYEEAKAQFGYALEIEPNSVEAYLGIADAYMLQADIKLDEGDIEGAIKEYKKILKILNTGYEITSDKGIMKKIRKIERALDSLVESETEEDEEITQNPEDDICQLPLSVDDFSKVEATESELEKQEIYDAFLRGEIATSEGQYLEDYKALAPGYPPSYYYIQAKGVSDKALVLAYANGACVANDVLYAKDGKLEVKGYFGRQSIGGSGLVDETYIVYETTMMDCNGDENCEYSIIKKFVEGYEVEDVLYELSRAASCTVDHTYQEYRDGQDVLIKFEEQQGFFDINKYLADKFGADTSKSYYEAVEWAVLLD